MLLLVHVISLLVHTRRLLSDRIYLKLALFCSSVYIFQTRLVIVKQKVKLWYLKYYVTGTRGTERVYPETLIGSENGYFFRFSLPSTGRWRQFSDTKSEVFDLFYCFGVDGRKRRF